MRRFFLAAFLSVTLLSISNKSEAQVVINYWNFNAFTTTDTFGSAKNPIPLIDADYSAISTTNAYMLYAFDSGTSVASKDSCWIDETTGSTVNAQQGAAAGNCLRIRNPSDYTALEFFIPTTNFKNISVSYALQSSSAKSGQAVESFAYSVDSGVTWKTANLMVDGANVDTLLDTAAVYINGFGLVTIGFGSDTTVNNTTKLVLRIVFKSYGTGAITGTSGNARIDNIAVMGGYLKTAITVQTPAAGATLYGGQQQTISYLPSGAVSNTRTIYFSTDSGQIWKQIVSTTQTSYTWTVPNVNSNNCFVEVVDSNGVTGISGRFSMRLPTITIVQPAAGGSLITGNSQLISYTTLGAVSDLRALDYSIDSGQTWTEIGITGVDTFTWTIPSANSHTCYVEVIDENGFMGTSGKFTIVSVAPPPPPPPTAPPGLIDYWDFHQLTTADTVPKTPRLKAAYSAIDTNTATITDTLQSGTSGSYVGWFDDVYPSVDPTDTTNEQLGDTVLNALRARNPSDSMVVFFHIPSTGFKNLSLTYALESSSTTKGQATEVFSYSTNGGVSWDSSAITVQGSNVDTLNVIPAVFQGTSWGLVTVTFGNDTTVNNNPNLILRIKFRGQNTGTSGNNRFMHVAFKGLSASAPPPPPPPPIPDSIVVTAPPVGDSILSGTQQIISYTVTATTSKSRSIDYSTNGGTSWINIVKADSTLTYNWTVPATPSTNAFVRVMDSTGVFGMIGPFTILVPGTVDSVWVSPSPVVAGATENIMWKATGYLGNSFTVNVFYDGVTPNLLTSGSTEASGSYVWTVPNAEVTGVFVQVVFASGSTANSAPFDIVAPASVSGGSNAVTNVELWPNPFQTQTTIQYQLNSSENVTLSIHDLLGREVESIQEGTESAGEHEIVFDGTHQPAGAYIYELTIGDTRYRGQLVIVR